MAPLLSLILAPCLLHAQAHYLLDTQRSHFTFTASSTMGSFGGSAQQFSGWAETSDATALRDARGSVTVQVASVQTGIGLRDRHLRADMQTDRFPDFVIQVDSAHFDGAAASVPAQLFSRITFRGTVRARVIGAHVRTSADTLIVTGTLPMTFSEFSFRPPARMLGTVRVKDSWQIAFDARFVRARP